LKGSRKLICDPLSPKQDQVLKLITEWHHGTMAANPANYREIAAEVGWKSYWAVPECLYALREKGAVRSIGPLMARPVQWEVIDE